MLFRSGDLFRSITDLKAALLKTIDVAWFSASQETKFASTDAAVAYYLGKTASDIYLPVNNSFNPADYAEQYRISPAEALLDLLSDSSLIKRPFEEFDTKFVYEYYCKPVGYRFHPYLYYIENPSILINPKQYFKSSSGNRIDNDPEYWNLSREIGRAHV